ncbi:hypothetical protein ARAM_004262 [Aspergillus rambellii]|uniref:Zn(2)-C6 fungal-type domain-containing protein n=2 Tax=Aspergillus subgen. Nidulantes TaxID=2720870 RepID=A0A0F8V3K2_9EURO|nr:hypothetical protein ARAM_004262 [Aspergillus rambellii]
MPRPKVLPANRLRAPEACLACRASKKRCSGTFPCSKCVRTGRAATCVPFRRSNPTSAQHQSSHPCKVPSIPGALDPGHGTGIASGPLSDARPVLPTGSPEKPGALHKTHSRMLRSLQGERVYVGRAASLSFLQLLRDTVTQHIGPSQFSHNVKSEDMLETETPHETPPPIDDDLDFSQEQNYIQTYRIAVSGFLNVLSDLELDQMLQGPSPNRETSPKTTLALRDILIAIGAQASKHEATLTQVDRYYFARAQRIAFASMLVNPSLEMVRLFILMSFYMLGACRRNAAFMYLGVAARAAAALGLHFADQNSVNIDEQQKRQVYSRKSSYIHYSQFSRARVWMSLCTLDLLVSSILGRPPATANLPSDIADSATNTLKSGRDIDDSLVASYYMSRILDDIVVRVYHEKAASTEVAESLLEKLKQWSNDLPEYLLSSPSTDPESLAAQEHIIGSLHVACTYHFAVIIVTRPFLISVLGVRLARLHQDSPGIIPEETFLEDPTHTRLANACVESALYMIQTCLEVHQSRLLLGNMCILKALVFAAALVPGFSMFSQKEVDTTLEDTFNGALEILRELSQQSAQAAHYYEILSLLRNAIDEQRQRLRETPVPDKKYVSKIFSLNLRNNSPQGQGSMDATTAACSSEGSQTDRVGPYVDPGGSTNLFDAVALSSPFLGWEGMELSLWDRFPFVDG